MESQNKENLPAKVIIVGGSIAGLSCAHALITAGWEVTVIDKTPSPATGSPTGAGLSLEPQASEIVSRWISDPCILDDITIPFTAELHQTFDGKVKSSRTLIRDDTFNYRCAHWADLHSIIYKSLPPGIILWGHRFLSLSISDDKTSVTIKAKDLQTNEIVEIVGDLLIAADGCLSMIRQHFLPHHKLRYSGYCAWRGVFDFSNDEGSNTITRFRRAYPELGNCLYLDYAKRNHCVLFEIKNKRLNWIWYFNTPEPDIEGTSVTMKVSNEVIDQMHEVANKIWNPELALLVKETKEPFINVIYDSDPLSQLVWDNVVLVGDAAHPTTPHASRSTNMSIIDAEVLGLCITKWGCRNLPMALQEFQSIRLPVVSDQVLHSRQMGRHKQGLQLHDNKAFDPNASSAEECEGLQHRTLPLYEHVPLTC